MRPNRLMLLGFCFVPLVASSAAMAAGLGDAPSWSVVGPLAGSSRLGKSVASAGDINGDGVMDIVIGVPHCCINSPNGEIQIYLGGSSGPSTTPFQVILGPNIQFGESVATAGDVNTDGFDDVIVGAPGYAGVGGAFAFLGSATGLGQSPAWVVTGDQASKSNFGRSVSSAGDVDGDGYDDVLVGDPFHGDVDQPGAAYLFRGSPSGLSTIPAWTIAGSQPSSVLGLPVASAGDINQDGFDDVIISERGYLEPGPTGVGGRVLVFFGSAQGLGSAPGWTKVDGAGSRVFGSSVASAGDVNNDGYDDIIIGDNQFNPSQAHNRRVLGRAHVFFGSPQGPSQRADWVATGEQVDAFFGDQVSSAGDVNADGFDDILVGAPFHSDGEVGEGRVFLYLSSSSGPGRTPAWTSDGNETSANWGAAIAPARDVNLDGFADVLVGAPLAASRAGRAALFSGQAH